MWLYIARPVMVKQAMAFFCLLWIPLSYVLRRLLVVGSGGGGIWPLLFGSLLVIIQFFVGPLVDPGGFGFYRWLSGFVDVVSMPVLVPLVLYLLFVEMRLISPKSDYVSFVLLWLIPLSAFRAMNWLSPPSPVMLVLVPVLWASLAVGMPTLIARARRYSQWYYIALTALCIAALPFAAATSWWAFFSHRPTLGFVFLSLTILPALISVLWAFISLASARGRAVPVSGITVADPDDEEEVIGEIEEN